MVAGLDERNTQLAAVSKAKTQLLATASHDVRQPIHAIGMLLDDWLPDASKEEHAHRIGVVRARIASISDMLQGLLDMSRLDLGVLKTTIRPVDLGAFMRGQAVAHAVSMQRKALAFTVDTSAVDGLLINTDIGLLGRILSNLLDNAYKYTWQGSVRLVGYRAPNGDACVSVIDTGIGIPESEQENIFGEYVRLSERHRDTDGVGIGLAVVTKGAALLGCHVEVQSLMDKGSTFTLVIPSTSFAHSAPTLSPQPTSPAAPAPTQTALGILLIEDDADTLAWTMRVLQRSGHETVGAQDVEAALERLRGGFVPHAVVSDFRLASHVNGVESIGQVRAYLGEPSLPAILLTGDLTVQVRRLAHEANVAVLHKPLAPARLLDAIQTLSLASPRQMAPSP
jgi:hypothetical protein